MKKELLKKVANYKGLDLFDEEDKNMV